MRDFSQAKSLDDLYEIMEEQETIVSSTGEENTAQ